MHLLTRLSDKPADVPIDEEFMAHIMTDLVEQATDEAKDRVKLLWGRHTPIIPPDAKANSIIYKPHHLLIRLFHSLIMSQGQPENIIHMQDALKTTIKRGILNACGTNTDYFSLHAEPITREAIKAVGMELMRREDDGVMTYLGWRMAESANDTGQTTDKQYGLEDCFAWALIRQCLLSPEPLTVVDLLDPHMACHSTVANIRYSIDPLLMPSVCINWKVKLTRGMRCDASRFDSECPLTLLSDADDVLLHHTRHNMAGPEIIFPAVDPDTCKSRLVVLQFMNRRDCTLKGSLNMLDLGLWHPTNPKAQQCLRNLLTVQPSWTQPIRVVVINQPIEPSTLHAITYFNLTKLQTTPILLLQPSSSSLGIPIAAHSDLTITLPYHMPAVLWPSKLRGYDYHENFGPTPPPPTETEPYPRSNLSVKLLDGSPIETLEKRANAILNRHSGDISNVVKHKTWCFSTPAVTVTVTHLQGAIALMQEWRAAGGQAEFV